MGIVACGGAPMDKGQPRAGSELGKAPAGEPAPVREAVDRFVLLNAAGSLYRQPDEAVPVIDHSGWAKAAHSPRWTRVYRLVADHGAWLEVENVPGTDLWKEHCEGPSETSLEAARIRFFAKRDDVFPVLKEPHEAGWEDGTAVALQAGVAVGKGPQGQRSTLRWLFPGSFELLVDIPDTKVGWWYTPGEKFAVPPFEERQDLPSLSIAAFKERALRFGGGGTVGPTPNPKVQYSDLRTVDYVYASEERGDDMLVELRESCVRLSVLTPARYVQETQVLGGLMGSMLGGGGGGAYTVRSGARLYWRGGADAGEAVENLGFLDEVEPDQSRRCFRKVTQSKSTQGADGTYTTEPVAFLELCAHPQDLLAPATESK